MKFSELKPQYWQRYRTFTPEQGGIDPLPEMDLSFICPKCGSPMTVGIKIGTEPQDAVQHRWHVASLPTSKEWVETVTITPSIVCNAEQHGHHRPPCNAHFSVINGEIV
jgi:hypothetical protein